MFPVHGKRAWLENVPTDSLGLDSCRMWTLRKQYICGSRIKGMAHFIQASKALLISSFSGSTIALAEMYRLLLIAALVGTAHAAVSTTGADTGELRCQYDNRTFMASAFVCADQLSNCVSIFGGSATGTTRPALCDNEDMQDKAAQCAKTCGICCEQPEYDCVDSPTSPINCTTNKRNCKNSGFVAMMAQYCPATCGLCNQGSCTDLDNGCNNMKQLCDNVKWYTFMSQKCARTCGRCGTSSGSCVDIGANCADHVNECNHPTYVNLMKTNCAKTCNFCSGSTGSTSTCTDNGSNCAANAHLCNNSVYYSLMTTHCAKTCNRCSGSGSSSASCTDTNRNCASWISNGFCSSAFYTQAQKQQNCARSCNLC